MKPWQQINFASMHAILKSRLALYNTNASPAPRNTYVYFPLFAAGHLSDKFFFFFENSCPQTESTNNINTTGASFISQSHADSWSRSQHLGNETVGVVQPRGPGSIPGPGVHSAFLFSGQLMCGLRLLGQP